MNNKGRSTLALSVMLALGITLVPVVLSSCGGGGGGGTGGGGGGTTEPPGGYTPPPGFTPADPPDPGVTEPNFGSIQENVFTPICSRCHTGGVAPEGLRLDADVSYGMLVNQPSSQVPSLMRVDPGNPDDSYIIQKLEGTAAVGERMPFGGPYLNQDTIDAIRQWISDGAAESAPTRTSEGLAPVTAAWPMDGATLVKAPNRIVITSKQLLDPSRIHPASVSVVNLDDIDPATLRPRDLGARIELSSLEPTVINVLPGQVPWRPGRYEVRVNGSSAMSVADLAGNLIDGDGDGMPGGDLLIRFSIEDDR